MILKEKKIQSIACKLIYAEISLHFYRALSSFIGINASSCGICFYLEHLHKPSLTNNIPVGSH